VASSTRQSVSRGEVACAQLTVRDSLRGGLGHARVAGRHPRGMPWRSAAGGPGHAKSA
jgi:hypothetical protein